MIRFILLCILCLSTGLIQAQKSFPPAKTPEQAISYFFEGLSEVNDDKMRAYLTNDFLLLEDGDIWNADSLTKSMARLKNASFSRKNSFRYIRTERKGASSIVAYHNRADIIINGKTVVREWLESAQLVRQGRRWKIKMMHSTSINRKN